jgi:hypothetical protein
VLRDGPRGRRQTIQKVVLSEGVVVLTCCPPRGFPAALFAHRFAVESKCDRCTSRSMMLSALLGYRVPL